MLDGSEHAQMVPMLPCGDIDEMAEFWTALGLAVTYRQVRPNPYVALGRNGIDLHYYGMAGIDPEQSHSTCAIVVPDTAPLYALFSRGPAGPVRPGPDERPAADHPAAAAGQQRRAERVQPHRPGRQLDPGHPPPRRPARAAIGERPHRVGHGRRWAAGPGAWRTPWSLADSHGDEVQAQRTLAGAVARHPEAPVAERAAAWAYLAELRTRLDDAAGAQQAIDEVKAPRRRSRTSRRRTRTPSPGPCARSPSCDAAGRAVRDRARSPYSSGGFARRRP